MSSPSPRHRCCQVIVFGDRPTHQLTVSAVKFRNMMPLPPAAGGGTRRFTSLWDDGGQNDSWSAACAARGALWIHLPMEKCRTLPTVYPES